MEIKTINASLLAKMFLAGAKNLENKKEWINELNVFPVPDGDTGTNMTMTIMSAANAVLALPEDADMKTVGKAISSGSLRGARGNSGVILSQILRGLAKGIGDASEVDVQLLCDALQRATSTAYKAVMKPKEGTILTVARGASDKALELVNTTDDILEFCEGILAEAEETLARTPDMLPVLKQAGVVDSGGQGLVEVMKGALDVLSGKEVDLTFGDDSAEAKEEKVALKYLYCAEFFVIPTKAVKDSELKNVRTYLESIGDEVVVLNNKDEKIRVHLHTNEPGNVLTEALKYGQLSSIKVENLSESDHEECPINDESLKEEVKEEAVPVEPEKEMGFVSVAVGDGLCSIFKELGVDHMIEGGQTMNPSTDDILNAVEKVNAKTVFILPNNKNIILAANQAADICESKKLIVIPTKTIPQGITALISFDPSASAEDNCAAMSEEINNVKTGQVTYAVRDTMIDDKEIKNGDFMGMGDAGLISVNADINVAFLEMIDGMVDEDSAVISIYWGEGADADAAEALGAKITEKYPDIEVEISEGGQAVYAYIVSVE